MLLDPLDQFLDTPDVRKSSHHKGLRGSLEAQHAAKNPHSNFFQIHHPNFFPDPSSLEDNYGSTPLCGVYERPLTAFISLFLTVANLYEPTITDRTIKSQKLGIPLAQIREIQISFIFS